MDPAEISASVGLEPQRAVRAGTRRVTPDGTDLGGSRPFSCWSNDFNVFHAVELSATLETLMPKLQACAEFFHRVTSTGGSIELFCQVFADGNWDEVLPRALMGRLAALHIDLRLDVYPKHDAIL